MVFGLSSRDPSCALRSMAGIIAKKKSNRKLQLFLKPVAGSLVGV